MKRIPADLQIILYELRRGATITMSNGEIYAALHCSLPRAEMKLLRFIEGFFAREGYCPSFTEMAEGCREYKSRIHALVLSLERRGFISRQYGRARSIVVIRPSKSLGADMVVEG